MGKSGYNCSDEEYKPENVKKKVPAGTENIRNLLSEQKLFS